MYKNYSFLKTIFETENTKLELFKNGLLSGKVAFPHTCSRCNNEILTDFSLMLNPDSTFPNNYNTKHYHIDCFSDLIRDVQNNTLACIDDMEIKISKLSERKQALDELKIYQTISADYGMHYLEFIKKVITDYTINNPTPISFRNEIEFQQYIAFNIPKIDPSFEILNNQVCVDAGELDLLGTDGYGNHIIIEVKLMATYHTISQVLFYMHSLSETKKIPLDKIRGIIVGMDIHSNLIHATTTFNNLIRSENAKIKIYKFSGATRKFIDVFKSPEG